MSIDILQGLVDSITNLERRIHELEVREPGAGMDWRDFTPIVNQGVGLTYTNHYSRWRCVGKLATIETVVYITSAGTAGQFIIYNLPTTLPAIRNTMLHSIKGAGVYYDISAGFFYPILPHPRGPRDIWFFRSDQTMGSLLGIDPAVTAGSGDQLCFFFTYECA
jgi:hypothetical protein